MASRLISMTLLFLVFPGPASGLGGERAKAPTLNDILERLQENLDRYDAHVPSLFCDEHVVSSQTEPRLPDESTVTDSVFRLRRSRKPDHTTSLDESHEIRSVNGEPARSQQMKGPVLLSGAFEGGLAVVSLSQAACMSYRLRRMSGEGGTEAYMIRFATVLTPRNKAGCLLQEESKGRAVIDPASMQVTHLEIVTPRHTIVEGNAWTSPVVGRRQLTVDYAPVLLGGETFWMPATITMRATSGFGFHQIVWSYRATYRNYHRLEVTTRMLPHPVDPDSTR